MSQKIWRFSSAHLGVRKLMRNENYGTIIVKMQTSADMNYDTYDF